MSRKFFKDEFFSEDKIKAANDANVADLASCKDEKTKNKTKLQKLDLIKEYLTMSKVKENKDVMCDEASSMVKVHHPTFNTEYKDFYDVNASIKMCTEANNGDATGCDVKGNADEKRDQIFTKLRTLAGLNAMAASAVVPSAATEVIATKPVVVAAGGDSLAVVPVVAPGLTREIKQMAGYASDQEPSPLASLAPPVESPVAPGLTRQLNELAGYASGEDISPLASLKGGEINQIILKDKGGEKVIRFNSMLTKDQEGDIYSLKKAKEIALHDLEKNLYIFPTDLNALLQVTETELYNELVTKQNEITKAAEDSKTQMLTKITKNLSLIHTEVEEKETPPAAPENPAVPAEAIPVRTATAAAGFSGKPVVNFDLPDEKSNNQEIQPESSESSEQRMRVSLEDYLTVTDTDEMIDLHSLIYQPDQLREQNSRQLQETLLRCLAL